MSQTISPATVIGELQLFVASLDRSVKFYQQALGFKLLHQEAGKATFGVGSQKWITLVEKTGAQTPKQTTGLYHFAILLPDRYSLAHVLYHLAEKEVEVTGAADHGVSEALYLNDPDGTGIELYCDRKRSEWPIDDLGKLQMGTDELDIDDLIYELRKGVPAWKGLPDATSIGHVHLHVRDLVEAENFYTNLLGFQLMQRYESGAIFVSMGGYHHHIGLNTWAGVGAPPPPENSTGLRWFEVFFPDAAALETLKARLQEASISWAEQDGGMLISDPSQNHLLIRAH